MKSALIPADMGDKKTARTCVGSEGCRGGCSFTLRGSTQGWGTAEEIVREHAAAKNYAEVRVHVYESGRGRTFKVWRSGKDYEAREVL